MKFAVIIPAVLALLLASSKGGAASPDLAGEFVVADGLEVTLWAESPLFYKPTNIDVDHRGRLWVAEGVNYRTFRGKDVNQPETIPFRHPDGDRIMILEDTDGDGVADSSKVFVQDKDLVAPLGVAVIGNRVFVSCSPQLIAYTIDETGDRPAKKEIFLSGFGGHDHDHGLHSVIAGPDGRLYFNAGNAGPHIVTDRDGRTIRAGSSYTGGSPYNKTNLPNMRSDDDHVWTGGLALRIDPNGRHLACHWHQDDPGVIPASDIYGAGGPTGVAVYEGDLLPAEFRGAVLNSDAGRNTVFAHRPVPDGAGFRLERTLLLSSQHGSTDSYRWDKVSLEDRSTWFRPSDVAVGTDGAVYVADWYDPVVGGHAMRSPNGYGRILRIAPKGSQPRAPKIDLKTTAGQVAALNSPAINVRFAAREKLIANQSAARPLLEELARSPNALLRARAAWFPGFAMQAFDDKDARVRVGALRAARQQVASRPVEMRKLFQRAVRDAAPAVRREVAVALRDVSLSDAQDLLLALAEQYDGRDRFQLEAIGLGCDGKEEALYPLLVARLQGGDTLRWSEPLANLVWRLHPVECVDAVAQRAGATSLNVAARQQAVDTLAFIPDRSAANAMLALAVRGPEDLRASALWWAGFRAGNDWKTFDLAARLPGNKTSDGETALQAKVRALRKTLLNTNATRSDREGAATKLAGSEAGGVALLKLAGNGQLPAQFRESVAEAIFRNPSLAVRAMASQYFTRPSRSGESFPPMNELAKRRGDTVRGRQVFQSESAGCAKCHAFAGQGGDIGPDLTLARTKLGREGVIDSILNPSAIIAAGYEPWLIETKDGEIYSGFVVSDGDTVTLKEPTGSTRAIPAKQIASRQQQKLSLMPDNISLGLTPQELVDLVEYLMAKDASRRSDGRD